MGTAPEPRAIATQPVGGDVSLALSWRGLGRLATGVAVVTSPLAFLVLHHALGVSLGWSILGAILLVAAFRGLVDVGTRRLIPWPSLFGLSDDRLAEEDVISRRRWWFWRSLYRLAWAVLVVGGIVVLIAWAFGHPPGAFLGGIPGALAAAAPLGLYYVVIGLVFLVINVVILFVPLIYPALRQIQALEPGDADLGVRAQDVRGQAEAKEDVRRIVALWQSGEAFEAAGGRRERGVLFHGAPGTGKTMLAKAVAGGFNCPFVSAPGSGFAGTFFGVDVLVVQYLAWRARRLARKWGGRCIVFIDEIDAIGMRRSSLAGGAGRLERASIHDHCFFGPAGALTESGDLVHETAEWRERLFAAREPARRPLHSPWVQRLVDRRRDFMMPGGMGGGMGQAGLQQLLVVMDGIGRPRGLRKLMVNRVNTILDALYVVPGRVAGVPLRLPKARPATEQIYFIGACNVPLDSLDPALIRPGRMGRHIWFRTPTVEDRKDIFDLYLGKVAHEPELDSDRRRHELASTTAGYSPAMIEQVCSMALTHALHEGCPRFGWRHIVEAMTTIEAGSAIGWEYVPDEARATAIHEAGHAVAGHVHMTHSVSTRLSIRRRGSSGGHHQMRRKEDRFASWRHEEAADLVWALGSMAAERVFYSETSSGVGGDVAMATSQAALMVGRWAMMPQPPDLSGRFADPTDARAAERRVMDRFAEIGDAIMSAGSGSMLNPDPINAILASPVKRRAAAELLGQAYMTAHLLIEHNREGTERVAEALMRRKEMFGDEVVELLDAQRLEMPAVDLLDDAVWPRF